MAKLGILSLLAVLLAIPFQAAAVEPIPVTSYSVQPVRVAGEVRGDWITIGCRVHVVTAPEGAGEVMTATDSESNVYAATVTGVWAPDATSRADPFIAGRARFSLVPPGATLMTSNTDPAVAAVCPST